MNGRRAIAIVLVVGLGAGACADKPVTAPRAVVPPTVPSELRAAATVADRFGDMVAVGVGLSNGSKKTYAITADRVLALDRAGNRVAPLSLTEAARQAGGATALVSGLKGAGGSALLGGLLGSISGAILGAAGGAGSAGKGAAIGAGIGVAAGAIGGFYESKSKTEREIIAQLGDLYLGGKLSKPGLPVSGFVFFPRGDYQGVFVVASEEPGGAILETYGPLVPKPPA